MSMSYDDIAGELAYEEEMKREHEGNDEVFELVMVDPLKKYIHVDRDVYGEAEEICREKGYTIDEAIERFIEAIADTGKLPFESDDETDENELARAETDMLINDNTAPSYHSAEELIASLYEGEDDYGYDVNCSFNVNSNILKDFENVCSTVGLNFEEAIMVFVNRTSRDQKIPFKFTEYDYLNIIAMKNFKK